MVGPSGSFTDMTNVGDVVLSRTTYAGESGEANDTFLMATDHVGLGFGLVGASQTSGTTSFTFPGSKGIDLSDVDESSLALDAQGDPVESFALRTIPRIGFYRYSGSGPITSASSWDGPTLVTDGYVARLAGGPAGLFLLSQDRPPIGSGAARRRHPQVRPGDGQLRSPDDPRPRPALDRIRRRGALRGPRHGGGGRGLARLRSRRPGRGGRLDVERRRVDLVGADLSERLVADRVRPDRSRGPAGRLCPLGQLPPGAHHERTGVRHLTATRAAWSWRTSARSAQVRRRTGEMSAGGG